VIEIDERAVCKMKLVPVFQVVAVQTPKVTVFELRASSFVVILEHSNFGIGYFVPMTIAAGPISIIHLRLCAQDGDRLWR